MMRFLNFHFWKSKYSKMGIGLNSISNCYCNVYQPPICTSVQKTNQIHRRMMKLEDSQVYSLCCARLGIFELTIEHYFLIIPLHSLYFTQRLYRPTATEASTSRLSRTMPGIEPTVV